MYLQITKGLGCRGHPQFFTFVDKLFDLFADDDVAWDAGRSMGLLGGNDPVLSKQNHAVVKASFLHIVRENTLTLWLASSCAEIC
jgi:hypothetical protein